MRGLLRASLASAPLRRREPLACACVLGLLAVAVFGSHVANGGFYNDDWSFASTFEFAPKPGFFGALQAFDWYSFRPVSMLYLTALHELFGLHAGLHLAWIAAMAVVMATALYWLLRVGGMEPLHAGAIAALVLIFPASDANRLWGAASIALPGIAFYLVGTGVALRGIAAGGRRGVALHACAVALYALSVMTYEIAAGAILLSVIPYRWRASWRVVWPRWLVDVAVTSTILALVTSGSWNEPQSRGTLIRHAGTIAHQAAVVLARTTVPFGTPRTALVIGALLVIATSGIVVWRRRPPEDPLGRQIRRWLLTALAATVAVGVGYAVFIPADPNSYAPLNPGQHNRVNGLAAIGFVLLIYSLAVVAATVTAQRALRWREWSAALAVCACLVVAWGWVQRIADDKAAWDHSAKLQDDIVASVLRAVPTPPAGSTVYAARVTTETAPGIPVFSATWDLAGALRLKLDDGSLRAFPAIPGTSLVCGRDGISAENANDRFDPQSAPYGNAFLVDVPTSTALRIRDRSTCRSAAARLATAPQ